MSAGKLAAQSFQAAQRLFTAAKEDADLASLLDQWQKQGTCTRTRIALSPAVFERACRELSGVVMVDEGVTEVEPGSTTCFASYPLDENDLPRILRHKRVPVLNSPITHTSTSRSDYVENAQNDDGSAKSTYQADVSLSGRAPEFMLRGSWVRIPSSAFPPAREAEMDQHCNALGCAEVAGSMPAAGSGLRADMPACPSKGTRAPWGAEGQTSAPRHGAGSNGAVEVAPGPDVVANASGKRPRERFDSSTPPRTAVAQLVERHSDVVEVARFESRPPYSKMKGEAVENQMERASG